MDTATVTRRTTVLLALAGMLGVIVHRGACQQRGRPSDVVQEEAGTVFTTVFHKYNARVRPLNSYPNPVDVNVHLDLLYVRSLDLLKQELECVVNLTITWNDNRLAWYANKVDTIFTEPSKVWVPSILYKNGVTPPNPLYLSSIMILSTGTVSWQRREVIVTRCHTKPADVTQICKIQLAFAFPAIEKFNITSYAVHRDSQDHRWNISEISLDALDPVKEANQSALALNQTSAPALNQSTALAPNQSTAPSLSQPPAAVTQGTVALSQSAAAQALSLTTAAPNHTTPTAAVPSSSQQEDAGIEVSFYFQLTRRKDEAAERAGGEAGAACPSDARGGVASGGGRGRGHPRAELLLLLPLLLVVGPLWHLVAGTSRCRLDVTG